MLIVLNGSESKTEKIRKNYGSMETKINPQDFLNYIQLFHPTMVSRFEIVFSDSTKRIWNCIKTHIYFICGVHN